MKQHTAPNHAFQFIDEILSQHNVNLLTLNPHKKIITSFVEIGELITEKVTDPQVIKALQNTLENIVISQIQNFPENIFWDFDFMVSSMLHQALAAEDGAVNFIETFGEKIVLLSELFGSKNEIRFRYVHDFMYGFDWARWVQREPATRADIEPFSLIFLDYLLTKSQELIQRIHLDNSQPYKLCDNGFRNPFTFSREPEDEYRLLTHLAPAELIPVAAWDWNACPIWNKPFQEMREQLALELNIQPQKH
ncbi:hypothetical protein Nos7524_1461 [Nostoc sp. PCC 7524]|uniref:hypothetical protein n=1 Tax=Nostoc sp. (strain ATCC 29411 / PCC 7524) TaxID=28072 RepID=UPI00029EFABB|nr:hypothetical protein [Nostoc sp. PCC 7524]AFY47339.1 hypothetical protein Nos7524_1461 [Nostoc sp. PCC 7524]